MIDPELRDIIEPELAKGEELLWMGRPSAKFIRIHRFILGLVFLFICMLPFLFALSVVRNIGVAIGILSFFTLIALVLSVHSLSPNFQVYGITQNRVIIKNNIWFGKTVSLQKGQNYWKSVQINESKLSSKTGTVYLSDVVPLIGFKNHIPIPLFEYGEFLSYGRPIIQGLFHIENVSEVEKLIPFPTLPWDG